MVVCAFCGRTFDGSGFKILLPGFQGSFDSADCAFEWSTAAATKPSRRGPQPANVAQLPVARHRR